MRALLRGRRSQRGAALLVFATVLVLGVAWYAIDTLGNGATRIPAQREMKTGAALQAAKQALLGYTAQYAARTDHDYPGRLPCPESLSAIGTANEGLAASGCSNTAIEIGRLPWRTLGIEPLRDGDGELLWYVLSPNFRGPSFPATAVPTTLPSPPPSPRPNWQLNFRTPGSIPLDGAEYGAVALIIAPGQALNTSSDPDTPAAPCAKVNQQSDRYASPLDPARFFECGNAAGSYASVSDARWSNDRVIAVSAAELNDAIAGPVADRLQRQVAPWMEYWRSTQSSSYWGMNFLPHASTFSDPVTNDLCGDMVSGAGLTEGLIPTARDTSTCNQWGNPSSISKVSGSGPGSMANQACSYQSSTNSWRCLFEKTGGHYTARITATAPNVAGSFRRPVPDSAVTYTMANTTHSVSTSFNSTNGTATVTVDLFLPGPQTTGFITVWIGPLPEADGLATDDATRWFIGNGWDRHVYYAISPGTRASPGAACNVAADPGCLVVDGLPSGTGNANDKRVVLGLMGRPINGQTMPTLESQTHAAGSLQFTASTVTSSVNDRLTMCPFKYTPSSGTALTVCN
jgi:hypothetical protein